MRPQEPVVLSADPRLAGLLVRWNSSARAITAGHQVRSRNAVWGLPPGITEIRDGK